MDNNFGEIIGVIIVLGLIVFFWKYVLIIIGVAVVAIAVYAIVRNAKKKKDNAVVLEGGHTKGQVDEFKSTTNKKIQNLRRYYYKLKDDEMRSMLDAVTNSFKKLIKTVDEEPANFHVVRRFLNITMHSCDNILRQAAMIYNVENLSESNKQALADSLEGLKLINTATNNQINKLYDNNAVNIDVELAVLKKSLQAKGLLDIESEKEINDEQ